MNEVLEFIKRRFKTDCDWISGNCYYFAIILLSRFPTGKIFYDVINGHFIFYYNNKFYDWVGEVESNDYFIDWDNFSEYDPLQKERIIKDCVM